MPGTTQSGDGNDATFTPEIDRLIMSALLAHRERMFHQLKFLGIERPVLLARAEQLCRAEEYLERCRDAEVAVGVRRCLRCDVAFVSDGPHNRLCNACRNRS